jgi:hypothetical protein
MNLGARARQRVPLVTAIAATASPSCAQWTRELAALDSPVAVVPVLMRPINAEVLLEKVRSALLFLETREVAW